VFARSPEVVARLHVEPHLGAGPKRSLEAQRHRCADAGTPVQQRGKSLPGDAEALRDLTDRYALGEILAENLTGVRRVVHVAHGSCLSVVVQIIDQFDVLPNEPEDHAPVALTVIEWNPLSSPVKGCRRQPGAARSLGFVAASSAVSCSLSLDACCGWIPALVPRLKNASSPLCLKLLITPYRKPTSDALQPGARFGAGSVAMRLSR